MRTTLYQYNYIARNIRDFLLFSFSFRFISPLQFYVEDGRCARKRKKKIGWHVLNISFSDRAKGRNECEQEKFNRFCSSKRKANCFCCSCCCCQKRKSDEKENRNIRGFLSWLVLLIVFKKQWIWSESMSQYSPLSVDPFRFLYCVGVIRHDLEWFRFVKVSNGVCSQGISSIDLEWRANVAIENKKRFIIYQ